MIHPVYTCEMCYLFVTCLVLSDYLFSAPLYKYPYLLTYLYCLYMTTDVCITCTSLMHMSTMALVMLELATVW